MGFQLIFCSLRKSSHCPNFLILSLLPYFVINKLINSYVSSEISVILLDLGNPEVKCKETCQMHWTKADHKTCKDQCCNQPLAPSFILGVRLIPSISVKKTANSNHETCKRNEDVDQIVRLSKELWQIAQPWKCHESNHSHE